MLTPPCHLILPLHLSGVRAALHSILDYDALLTFLVLYINIATVKPDVAVDFYFALAVISLLYEVYTSFQPFYFKCNWNEGAKNFISF
jgi:hypothetical protein